MDFLTPEVFNFLVVSNLIVGLGLVAFRFYQDMTRPLPEPSEQVHDKSSQSTPNDTQ